ncbi:uncharacterized protein FOMMEDRAFT_89535 [Fomitiporia mediterranea MF3/22]|uniref:uncharacterized protein n=1 Tax=Fomitiporia mediterranea (strain MF3/22) TaxID=694068 RepID=UPI0004407A78|nr:uncharacterized protein FOMMEDRAFT_89535 [Fomitiporia mediterranea MF3/22]EJD01114.1 hypothetical protein FOMMEDRAFT_89535 [Fomitiporia mediterranea MF3/22]
MSSCSSRRHSQVHASLLSVVILFPVSTAVVFLSMSTLPITFAWPRTLSDLAQVERDLNLYFRSGSLPTAHIVGVLAVSAVWKHAWSVPGSVLWNVLAGALFHPLLATLLMTVLTSIGSVLATLLATPLAPILTRLFPRPVELTRAALEGSFSLASKSVHSDGESKSSSVTTATSASSPAWARLSVLRLIGIVPWSALNIACGLTGVSLYDCFLGAFIGTLPWTAVTCQIGDILETVSNASENGFGEGLSKSATVSSVLARPSMVLELIFLTILSLAPIVFRDHLRKFVPSSEGTSTVTVESEEYEEKEMTIRSSQREQLDEWDPRQTEGSEEDPAYDEMERRGRRLRRQRWTWQRLSMSIPRWSTLGSPLRSSFPKVERDDKQ